MTQSAWPPDTWKVEAPRPPRKVKPRKETAGGRVVLILVLVLALLVGGGYAAAYLLAGDRVPHGTTIAGVDVGGRTPSEAEQRLAAKLAPRLQAPIPVTIDGQQRTISPGVAGLGVDFAGSVAAAGGRRSWSADHLWTYYTDGRNLSALISLDPTQMTDALHRLAARVDKPAVDGAVSFTSAGVAVTQPVVGRSVDVAASQNALLNAFAEQVAGHASSTPVNLPTKAVQPDIDAADVNNAVEGFANAALSGPVTLDFEHGSVRLATRQLVPLLSLEPRGGHLVPQVDPQLLLNLLDPALLVGHDPIDATVGLVDGAPAVVPSVAGTTYTATRIAATVVHLLGQREGRDGQVPTSPVPALFTDKEAAKLGVTDQIASVTTTAPGGLDLSGPVGDIDQNLLHPGDALSLDTLLGSTDLPAQARIQLASTVYEAALEAGMTVTERHAPLVFFPRFAVGEDAIIGPGQDLQLRNISRYGELVTASSSRGSLTVTVWSHKAYDVSLTAGTPYDVVPPSLLVDTAPGCVPVAGHNGFDIDVTRSFRREGRDRVFATDQTTSSYLPVNTVRCRPAPPATSPPSAGVTAGPVTRG